MKQLNYSSQAPSLSKFVTICLHYRSPFPSPIPDNIIPLFIRYLTLTDEQHVPTIALTHLNDFLLASTIQPTHTVLSIFSSLTAQIKSCPPSTLIKVLEILGDGLRTWISAEQDVFTNEEFADNVSHCNNISTSVSR